MTEPIEFDKHKFIKRMLEVGFTELQAEALATAQVNLISHLATNNAYIEKSD